MSQDKIRLKPVGAYILVVPMDEETKTPSGLIIQSTKNERPQMGKVVAMGSGERDENGKIIEPEFKVGDTVAFKKYSPDEFEVDGTKYLVMKMSDVIAVLKD